MATSSEEKPSESTDDLVSLLENGNMSQEELQAYAAKGELDAPGKDGRTPLMVACLKGLQDTVKFLLANGADPNSKNKDGNSPVHFACMVEESKEEDSLGGRYYHPSKWMDVKLAIVNLLLDSGAATLQNNREGWNALYVAALYQMKDLVDLFGSRDDIPLEKKIKAYEIQGVSEAALSDHGSFSKVTQSFQSFSRAFSLQQHATCQKEQTETSDLAACFAKISLNECHTQDELDTISRNKVGLKTHAYLLGERHFTDNLKQKYLYPSLAVFGSDLLFREKMFEEGFQVLTCAIGFEGQDKLKLGSVIDNLANKCGLFVFEHEEPNPQIRQHVIDLLRQNESIFQYVGIDHLSNNVDSIIDSFGEVLFNEAFYCPSTHVDILTSALDTILKSVKIIRSRVCTNNPDMYSKLPSLTFKIMELLGEAFVDNIYSGIDDESLLRVKFVILKVLFCDNVSYTDRTNCNILHLMAYCASAARDYDYLMDLARAFVRHGCPLDVVNHEGQTPREILEEEEMYDHESDPEFLMIVCPPTAALRLEELSIRAILKHNVSYQEVLPQSLCAMIDTDITDLLKSSEKVDDENKE